MTDHGHPPEADLVAEAEQHLRSVATLVKYQGRAILGQFDITPPQFEALLVMMRHPNLTMGELCQQLYLASSTVTDLVDRLERNQLVQRVRDTGDRRVVRLRLRSRAKTLMQAVMAARRSYLAKVFERLDPVDRRALVRSLQRLDRAMQQEACVGPGAAAGQEGPSAYRSAGAPAGAAPGPPAGGRRPPGLGEEPPIEGAGGATGPGGEFIATAASQPGDGGGNRWNMKVAIIGGTGIYDPSMLEEPREQTVVTPYGRATVRIGQFQGQPVVFLARHGVDHSVPPHRINYRANIYALAALGVRRIIATAAVGSLRQPLRPGHFVLVDQFLDFTKSRPSTFFDGEDGSVVHVDVTEPYCPALRSVLYQSGQALGLEVTNGGVYVCTEGPRFETPAEIRMYERLGGDVVGMTSVPEVVLAREAGICYATIAMVTNYAAGMAGKPLTHAEVLQVMADHNHRWRRWVVEALPRLVNLPPCPCSRSPAPLRLPAEERSS